MAAEQKISSALEKELESMDKECIRPLQASYKPDLRFS